MLIGPAIPSLRDEEEGPRPSPPVSVGPFIEKDPRDFLVLKCFTWMLSVIFVR